MSLIISVYVGEGIVMASDSRTTYNRTENKNNVLIQKYGVHITDTTNKTFLCPNNIGLSTCGDASINSKPITGYIEAFIRDKITEDTDVDSIPDLLIEYFNSFTPVPKVTFFVAGYTKKNGEHEQSHWKIFVERKEKVKDDTLSQGATWAGETDVLSRLLGVVEVKNKDGNVIKSEGNVILWNYFTLQDAIDYAEYAIKTTVDTMKFQNRLKTVGGHIDILVLKPNEAFWIKKKELT